MTKVAFQKRLRFLRACRSGRALVRDKTLIQAWRTVKDPSYQYWWLRYNHGVEVGDRVSRAAMRDPQFYFFTGPQEARWIATHFNPDGTRRHKRRQ